jgi:hypothetical protein
MGLKDSRKKVQVRWTAQRQERHSAPMTAVEARRFVEQLRTDDVEDIRVEEAPPRRLFGRRQGA